MEELPLDFTRYLSHRLGLSTEHAASLLVAWLKEYEPLPAAGDATSVFADGDDGAEAWQQTG